MKKLLDKINNSNKMKKIMPLFLVICLLALVTGLSYAIWNKTLISNVNTITSGVVSMSFTESSNVITISDALPISDSEGKVLTNYFDFSVTSNMNLNDGDPDATVNYTIELESLTKKEKYYPTTITSENLETFVNYVLDKELGLSLGDEGYEEFYDEIKSTCENGTECIGYIQDAIDDNNGIAEYLLKIEVAEYVDDKFTIKKNLTDKQINSCAKYLTEKDGYSVGDEGYEEKLSEYLITCNNTPLLEKEVAEMYGDENIASYVNTGILIDNGSSYSYNTSATDEMVNACINLFMDGMDSSDSYDFNMATLYCDGSPELQFFAFIGIIDTKFVDLVHNGLISYQESTLSKGYDALEDSQIKVYLEDITNDTSVAVEPTLISSLTNSDNGKLLFSGSHVHSYGVNTINTKYRLRAWIDYDVDASSWTDENKYEYKFRVNINSSAEALEREVTPTSCFDFITDGAGKAKIINYKCGIYSSDEVITDVIIPSTITASITYYPSQEELTDDDRKECATFFTEEWGNVSSESEDYEEIYQKWYDICSDEVISPDSYTLDQLRLEVKYGTLNESRYQGISNLKVFETTTLPEAEYTVTTIGNYAFRYSGITSLTIPSSITKVEKLAFYRNNDDENDTDFASITVDKNNKVFNDGDGSNVIIRTDDNVLVAGCKNSVIPSTVTAINDYAFYSSPLVTKNITIPDSVKSIGDYAFAKNSLTSVTIPNSVTKIGEYAFAWNDLTSVTIPNSVTTIESCTFLNNNLTSVTIPNSVTTIGLGAFYGNDLTSVTIPNSVTTIGLSAFYGNDLTSVTIPSSVTSIHESSFDNKVSVTIDPNNTKYNDGGIGSIIETATNKLIKGNASGTIPNTIVEIGEYAFSEYELTSIVIPDSITIIGEGAFLNNDLTSLTLGNSVTTIEDRAFYYNKLTNVTIPNSVTTIGDSAFFSNKLTSVTISNSVITIGYQAFAYNNLTSVTIPNSVIEIGEQAFYNNDLRSVVINSGSNLTAETGIGTKAFYKNQNLTIYNNSSKAFKWIKAVSGVDDETTFVTGTVPSYKYDLTTYNAVTVTTGSPS